ncbi:hypothetical protein M3Y96_00601700 [Aphelenchoides besseyi]|nr:hypothetical protein M3Y96_00601700 [Aphelenchoides besseyi]
MPKLKTTPMMILRNCALGESEQTPLAAQVFPYIRVLICDQTHLSWQNSMVSKTPIGLKMRAVLIDEYRNGRTIEEATQRISKEFDLTTEVSLLFVRQCYSAFDILDVGLPTDLLATLNKLGTTKFVELISAHLSAVVTEEECCRFGVRTLDPFGHSVLMWDQDLLWIVDVLDGQALELKIDLALISNSELFHVQDIHVIDETNLILFILTEQVKAPLLVYAAVDTENGLLKVNDFAFLYHLRNKFVEFHCFTSSTKLNGNSTQTYGFFRDANQLYVCFRIQNGRLKVEIENSMPLDLFCMGMNGDSIFGFTMRTIGRRQQLNLNECVEFSLKTKEKRTHLISSSFQFAIQELFDETVLTGGHFTWTWLTDVFVIAMRLHGQQKVYAMSTKQWKWRDTQLEIVDPICSLIVAKSEDPVEQNELIVVTKRVLEKYDQPPEHVQRFYRFQLLLSDLRFEKCETTSMRSRRKSQLSVNSLFNDR